MDAATIGRGIGAFVTTGSVIALQSCGAIMDTPVACTLKMLNPALQKNATDLERKTKSEAFIQQTTDGVVKINIPKPDETEVSNVLIKIGNSYVSDPNTGQPQTFTLPVQKDIPLSDLSLPQSAFDANPKTGTYPGISESLIAIEAFTSKGSLIAIQQSICDTTKGER